MYCAVVAPLQNWEHKLHGTAFAVIAQKLTSQTSEIKVIQSKGLLGHVDVAVRCATFPQDISSSG
ncbi:hypothetical protein M433DRAFT_150218 [Acidomyces richmondensis BFW]|nr:MAG: hypothetical protein FE78DRAFT_94435 [Acidomyces sp. 'richmondensis']KYG49259.1 hypothetical protein M433DRAFT_150218 [Acidomyces richmondensis BFW]